MALRTAFLFLLLGPLVSCVEFLNTEQLVCAPTFNLRWGGGTPPYTIAVQFVPDDKSVGNISTGKKYTRDDPSFTLSIPDGFKRFRGTVIDNNGGNDTLTLNILDSNSAQCSDPGPAGVSSDSGNPSATSSPIPIATTQPQTTDSTGSKDSPSANTKSDKSNLSSTTDGTPLPSNTDSPSSSFVPSGNTNTTTTTGNTAQSNPIRRKELIGAVIGGVVGSVVLSAFCLSGLLYYMRRRRSSKLKLDPTQRVDPFDVDFSPAPESVVTFHNFTRSPVSPSNEKNLLRPNRNARPASAIQPQTQSDLRAQIRLTQTVPANWEQERTGLQAQIRALLSENAQLSDTAPPSYSPT